MEEWVKEWKQGEEKENCYRRNTVNSAKQISRETDFVETPQTVKKEIFKFEIKGGVAVSPPSLFLSLAKLNG